MPIMLCEAALDWGPFGLANNDVVLEVVTPKASREVMVFTSIASQEYKAWEREFHNRQTFDWDAFIFWVPPEKQKNKEWLLDARAAFHIHMIAQHTVGQGLLIQKLLPKSSFDREGPQINLADEPLDRWDGLVATMNERTRVAVERIRIFYVERFQVRG
jgi:hypothetical protein